MAGYTCDGECGGTATLLITRLENGEVVALCSDEFMGYVLAMADQFRRAQQEEAAAADQADGEAPEGAGAVPNPPGPKRRRAGHHRTSAALDSEASPFPDATPVDG